MHDDPTLSFNESRRAAADPSVAEGKWGSFQLLARVGSGGFGEVYRAWDPDLEREVALKLLLPGAAGTAQSTAQSDEEYKAMLREARALASVRHPNIVPVYGIDRHDGRVGFWTDFVKGKTLSLLLRSQGPFGYREAALIGLDVARALSAVHRAGILHRDIKAGNVMREEGGRILLMDFGLSTLPRGQTDTAGTPNYMAPELWQGQPATVQTDIYAMGVLLYFLVTGEHPVRLGGLSAKEAIEALAQRRPLMDLRSDLPESFLRAVSVAMDADPAKRFASAGQLAAALSESLGTAAPAELDTPPAPKKNRLWAGIGAGALVLLLALGVGAAKIPKVRSWLHLDREPAAAGVPASIYDEYVKAEELLQKSYSDKNVADAIAGFQKILKEDPNFALAEAGLGSAYFKQFKNSGNGALLDQAKTATEAALALAKDNNLAPAYVTLAQIEATAGHTDVALEEAQRAIQLDSRNADAYAAEGDVYKSQGRTSDAIAAVKKAIDLAPENSMWPVKLGNFYMNGGNLQDAAAQWQSAVEIDPQNTFAYYDLGVVNVRLDKLADARLDFQKVLQSGSDADSYKALGSVAMLEGNYNDAVQMYEKAISLEPSNPEAWANLGSAYIWSGAKQEEVLQAYGKAIKIAEEQRLKDPEDAALLADLANYYASIRNMGRSLPLARKAIALSPDDPNILYSVGESYELLGQRAKAIPLISEALAEGYHTNDFQRSPELATLRSDPDFRAALEKAKATAALDKSKKMN